MAFWFEPTDEIRRDWTSWLAERPDCVRAVASRFEPWRLYRLKGSNQRVTLHSYDEGEDGSITLQVQVLARFNFVAFERRVFGIKPEDLEECDLPGDEELVGNAGINPETLRGHGIHS